MKKTKILFFGLGSIGKRHAKLLNEHCDFELYAYRSGDGCSNKDLNIVEFTSLEEAFSINPDIAFITNPTFLHVDTAIECAKRNIDLFIEKPLSHNLENLDVLNNLINEKNIYSYVAFCTRFHPVLKTIKTLLKDEQVIHVNSINTSYLPDWRPHQDYRKNYSAYLEKGGGVLLEMMHELDYHHYLFGNIKKLKGRYGKASNLDIDCEDFADLLCEFDNGISSSIFMNIFSKARERKVKVYCTDKVIEGDFNKDEVTVFRNNECIFKEDFKDGLNSMYLGQIKYFLENYSSRNYRIMNTVPEATNLLKILLDFKK